MHVFIPTPATSEQEDLIGLLMQCSLGEELCVHNTALYWTELRTVQLHVTGSKQLADFGAGESHFCTWCHHEVLSVHGAESLLES